MKILFHILLDMNQKTKISTKFPRSKLGVATVVLSLGGVAVYSLGVINPLQASQSEYLQVDGVQNSVQYLTSLVIDSPTAKVEFKYDDASQAVRASGSLNMQNLVVGQGNESSVSSVVFWWTKNNNQWTNSVIVWGNSTTNEGNNNVIVLSPGSTSSSENTAILNGQYVVTNGKNITVVNGENSNVRGNYVTVFGDSSVAADHVVVFGDKVNNNKSNTFVFNGQDTEFVPEQESAFYANSKVAINGDLANATLDVHGGMMIGHRKMGQSNTYTAWKNPATSGTIALFSKYGQTGLCGYDGKDNLRRVPLSESARKFWLCAPIRRIWDLPANAVSNNHKKQFPQVWNQNKGHWEWESPKWIYGSKDKPQHFLCKDGFVPDNADPIGKTGVKCIPCEWAKSGDLSCTTQKGDNSAATPHCPQGTNYNETSKKCEGTKSTPCVAWDNIVSFNPDTQIETYNADTWIWKITQECKAVKCQEGYILDGERCVKKTTPTGSCIGEIPEGGIENPKASEPTLRDTERVPVEAESTSPCSYLCAEGYIIGKDQSGKNACLKCEAGTWNPIKRTCTIQPTCPEGTFWGKNWKWTLGCHPEGNCTVEGEIDNSTESWSDPHLRDTPENFKPLGHNREWKYVQSNPKEHSCEYTCSTGYIHRNGLINKNTCQKIGCLLYDHDKEAIQETYMNAPLRLTSGWSYLRDMEVVSIERLQSKKAEIAEWCFVACKPGHEHNGKCKMKKEEKHDNKYKCDGLLWWVEYYEIYSNPIQLYQKWDIVDKSKFSSMKENNGKWCFATCKDSSKLVEWGGRKECMPQSCEKDDKYWYTWHVMWWCYHCPKGKIGDKNSQLTPTGIPTRCIDMCGDGFLFDENTWGCKTSKVSERECKGTNFFYDRKSNKCISCIGNERYDANSRRCK